MDVFALLLNESWWVNALFFAAGVAVALAISFWTRRRRASRFLHVNGLRRFRSARHLPDVRGSAYFEIDAASELSLSAEVSQSVERAAIRRAKRSDIEKSAEALRQIESAASASFPSPEELERLISAFDLGKAERLSSDAVSAPNADAAPEKSAVAAPYDFASPIKRRVQSLGRFYFGVPEQIRAFVPAKVAVEIVGGAPSEPMHAALMTKLATDRPPVTAEIETTTSMIVELQHDSAAIKSELKSPRRQPVRVGKTTRWEWEVVGLRRGSHELAAKFYCVCRDGDYETHPETAKVKVTVNVAKSARSAGKWVAAAVFGAFALGVYAETRKPVEEWFSKTFWTAVAPGLLQQEENEEQATTVTAPPARKPPAPPAALLTSPANQ